MNHNQRVLKIGILLLALRMATIACASDLKDHFLFCLCMEMQGAQAKLKNASQSVEEKVLSEKLQEIFFALESNDQVEAVGTDAQLRPSYVIMQGLIEKALTEVVFFEEPGLSSEAFYVTPRIPTPMRSPEQGSWSWDQYRTYAHPEVRFRQTTLKNMMKHGIKVYAIYSAESTCSPEAAAHLEHYAAFKRAGANFFVDLPLPTTPFPPEMTGAIYKIGREFITVESRQLGQIQATEAQKWMIKIGEPARLRAEEVSGFVSQQTGAALW